MNFRLAVFLAWRGLRHHRTVALATVLGVAIGMTVVGTILIVDRNSQETRIPGMRSNIGMELVSPGRAPDTKEAPTEKPRQGRRRAEPKRILRVTFERGAESAVPEASSRGFPTQEGRLAAGLQSGAPPARRGEEDYQAMRLAVRLASLMAFCVGAVIVFYTMRFSVASRSRELSLLLCLGEKRRNVALSLLVEAAVLGAAGTLIGLMLAFPTATALIEEGISTTGRIPSHRFAVPWAELAGMGVLSLCVALLGVAGPVRVLYGMRIVEILQPRFMSPGIDLHDLHLRGFGWLLPALTAAAYLALRPFLKTWLSVVEFFVLEVMAVGVLALAVLWWVRPLLRWAIRIAEVLLKPLLPLESLLVGRRLRLTSRKLVFTVAGVTLVFSLLTALHDITGSLKYEIEGWAREALEPYVFLRRKPRGKLTEDALQKVLEGRDLHVFRMSRKVEGELPFRLVSAADVNPYLAAQGRPELGSDRVLVSRTLASRFGLSRGDRMRIDTGTREYRFLITEVADDLGFFADDGQYVDLKSWFLFGNGSPLFAQTLEPRLGELAVMRKRADGRPSEEDMEAIRPNYHVIGRGWEMGRWQKQEIDRDFLIFDFILIMTVVLAAVGVANSILIQVHARERELSVLRTVGVSRGQTTRLLLVEGAVIGIVSAFLAIVLGHTVGAISVAFLDRFTLFDYELVVSARSGLSISLLAIGTCCIAAIYPALVANRISSAESLHYE